ncbi:MgtC/SapB family protein OS=Streptomyces rimosus subsp. rimosus (strain ATCC / DSM 40260/ JCM 4667 / NRRL 2234) OX=1265868 GN=SRIM_034625 PE=3 SV=1 [Streptomyces rimosus subsp. rimosus]
MCTSSGFQVTDVQVETGTDDQVPAEVLLRLEGRGSAHPLVERLTELDGVRGVSMGQESDRTE